MSSNKVVLILQARMGSTRLPGKSMLPLAGRPLVSRILERLKRCRRAERIVLATTCKSEDRPLAELAAEEGVDGFRGAEEDLVDRYYQAARCYGAGVIVRFPADNPVPEPAEIDRIIACHLNDRNGFSSNLSEIFGNGYPDGIGAEVFDFEALQQIRETCKDPVKREHPHLNFFDYATQKPADPERFRVGTIRCPAAFRRPDLRLDVNTQNDYEFLARLYESLYPQNPRFHITDIIAWHDRVYGNRRQRARSQVSSALSR